MVKLIVANWKMNPDSLGRAILLAKKVDAGIPKKKNIEVVIAAPFPFLAGVGKVLRRARLGAQDAFWESGGAYTGEVSWHQLKHLGVEYVIIGHSERRKWVEETDETIHKKVLASLQAGLKVILCVGEPLAIRKKGLAAAKHFVKKQLEKDLKLPTTYYLPATSLIIAYEPIWAISTSGAGKQDKPEDAADMIQFIKSTLQAKLYKLQARVLYGGSVNSQNVKSFVYYKGVDGVLVGGASLKAEEFVKIIHNVNNGNNKIQITNGKL